MNDVPSINQLSEEKTQIKSWIMPIVRKRLDKLAAESGMSRPKHTSNILTGAMYPELAGPIRKFAQPSEPDFGGDHPGQPAYAAWTAKQDILTQDCVNGAPKTMPHRG